MIGKIPIIAQPTAQIYNDCLYVLGGRDQTHILGGIDQRPPGSDSKEGLWCFDLSKRESLIEKNL